MLASVNPYFANRYAKLTWKDNASNEHMYEVWRSNSPTAGFVRIQALGGNTITFTQYLGGFALPTDYYYKVRAINTSTGASEFSNTVRLVKF